MIFNFLRFGHNLENIHKLCSDLTGLLDEDKIFSKLIEILKDTKNITRASIMIYDEKSDSLVIKNGIGISNRAKETVKLKPDQGIAGRVFSTGKAVLVSHTLIEQTYKSFFDNYFSKPDEKLLCLPIKFKSNTFGVINLHSRADGKPLNKYDMKIYEILANQTAMALSNTRFYNLAIFDSLTNLFIHQYFKQRLDTEFEIAKKYALPISLLLFDIDYFKKLNDTYGHQTGDFVLKNLAILLKENIPQNSICARYGGEEFGLILPLTDIKNSLLIAENLRKKIQTQKFYYNGHTLNITVSIGIFSIDFGENSKKLSELHPENLIEYADKALYKAKASGRNCINC